MVNRQFALFFRESRVLPMPADQNAVASKNRPLLRREKSLVLLKCSIDAVPGVGSLAVPVGDPIEAVENSPVMRRMNLRIIQ